MQGCGMDKIEKYLRFRQEQMGKISPKKTAVLVIDMQKYQVERGWTLFKAVDGINPGMLDYFLEQVENKVVPNLQKLLNFCRENALPIIYTKFSSFMPDGSDLSPALKTLNALSKNFLGADTFPHISAESSEIIDALKPNLDLDWVLQKNTSGTFISTRLDNFLRNMGIDTVLVTGVVTHFCVESTAREAADYGFNVYIIDDCCAGWSPELHENTLRTFQLNYGFVLSSEKLIQKISHILKQLQPKAKVTQTTP